MVAFLVTVLAILLLVGIIYLLLQEPQLLAAGSAIAVGVMFATLPLVVTMPPFFGAIVFGAGAVAITYGVMSINAYRRTQELRRELAIRQVRASIKEPAYAEDAAPSPRRAADPDEELLALESARIARAARRAGPVADVVEPVRMASTAKPKRRAAAGAGFEEELARLERTGSSARGSGARAATAMDRARSLSRLARRRS